MRRWTQIATDGPITAPRWYHHLGVKTGLSITIAFVLLAVFALLHQPHFLLAGLISGPGVFLTAKVIEALHPTDPAHHTLWEHVADHLADSADAMFATAGCLILGGWTLAGLCLLVWCIAALAVGQRSSRP